MQVGIEPISAVKYDRRLKKFGEYFSCQLRQFCVFSVAVLGHWPNFLLSRLVFASSAAFRVFSYPSGVR